MDQSPRLSLSYVAPAQAQKHVTVNETFRRLDALVQASVSSRTISAQPASPSEGEGYILTASPTGASWDQMIPHNLVFYQDLSWVSVTPVDGLRVWVADEMTLLVWQGGAWQTLSADQAAIFGVNASGDAVNRLTVKSDAVLFSHDDVTPGNDDCIVKVNKAAPGDTASHIFQTGFSGRAEFGLTGDDNFHIKVSPDNFVTTKEAIVIDKDDGYVGMNINTPVAPLHVHVAGGTADAALLSSDTLVLTREGGATSFSGVSVGAGAAMIFKGVRANGTLDTPTSVANGNFTFLLLGGGYDGAVNRTTAGIEFKMDGTVSSGTVPQRIDFATGATSSRSTRMGIAPDGSVIIGSPSGGEKGAGTLNAQAVYDDNTLLSCYVFDQVLDGEVSTEKWDAKVPDRIVKEETDETGTVRKTGEIITRHHEQLRKFAERLGGKYDPLTLDGYAAHWQEKRHLTSMPNEATFEPEAGMPAGAWIQRLVETVEIQAVLIEQLNTRTKALESQLRGRP